MLSLCPDVKINRFYASDTKLKEVQRNAQNLPAQKAPETEGTRLQKKNEDG